MTTPLGDWEPPRPLTANQGVYHYTSASGLLGMIQNGTLWATEASGMNDLTEVVQGQKYLYEALTRLLPAEPGTSGSVREALDGSNSLPEKPSGVFVLCASLRDDDANQWRLYGDGGRGYSVELDSGVPLCVRSPREPVPAPRSVEDIGGHLSQLMDAADISPWSRVMYTDEEQEEGVRSLIDWAREAHDIAEQAPVLDPEWGEPTPTEWFRWEAHDARSKLTRLMKTPGFAGEDEVRTVVTFGHSDRHVRYRSSRYGIVRHVELAPAHDGKDLWFAAPAGEAPRSPRRLPIRSIRLGPALNFELAAPAVESLLRAHGFESVEVLGSEVPLR
ncbi:DUF2971 domain-containing protein [Cellulomonas dongxiuzhuiae]|uniref:DUF2971 domain-containing protein n=1 Tax=Cellulomonas dongxiuzhuiae TaxID=2819979 RepID=UPI001AAF538C|nr:DUF2971 domain-containing protein [Cellulomonas dongxiuzhuiae]MBO3089496.1 DUF2971 domain-containing protein [Cellulomonas dongxiuzhuiae]